MNPTELRETIARDLAPARPLFPPAMRALLLVPLALVTIVAVPSVYFFREDFASLGLIRSWGLSFAEAIGGLIVVGLALRESIPGRALPRATLAAAVLGGLALPVVVFLATAERFDVGVPDFGAAYVCFRTSLGAAVPGLVAATFLVARAFPLRPGVAGLLYGLGCGVIADAGLRLFCEYTMPVHVLEAHGGAILAAMVIGQLLSFTTRRR